MVRMSASSSAMSTTPPEVCPGAGMANPHSLNPLPRTMLNKFYVGQRHGTRLRRIPFSQPRRCAEPGNHGWPCCGIAARAWEVSLILPALGRVHELEAAQQEVDHALPGA